jgi:hypothetical protein
MASASWSACAYASCWKSASISALSVVELITFRWHLMVERRNSRSTGIMKISSTGCHSGAQQVILSFSDIMPDPELSERLWAEKGLLAFIWSTICPEANSNVKYEMSIFGDRGHPALSECHSRRSPFFFPAALKTDEKGRRFSWPVALSQRSTHSQRRSVPQEESSRRLKSMRSTTKSSKSAPAPWLTKPGALMSPSTPSAFLKKASKEFPSSNCRLRTSPSQS